MRSENGLVGGGEYGGQAARTPCALRAVMAHSSPEPAALSFGGGLGSEETIAGWVARVRSLAIPGLVGEGREVRSEK